jgi:hypothetical protein
MENNKNVTAVEWLGMEVKKFNTVITKEYILLLCQQAKEMEKVQHGVTFHVGVQWIQYQMDSIHGCLEYWDKEPPEFETFYNETYGGNK